MATIQLPDALPLVEKPGGDPAGSESLASSLLDVASRIADFADEGKSLASVDEFWLGQAAAAYTAHATTFAEQQAALAPTLKRVSRGVDVFAEQLRTLLTAHETLNGDIQTYNRNLADLRWEVTNAGDVGAAEITAFQLRAQSAFTKRAMLIADIERQHQRVTDNEKYLAELFASADTLAEARRSNASINSDASNAIDDMPSADDGPEAMSEWWNDLSEAEQDALIAGYPDRLGSADGLPASVRDEANRLLLDSDLSDLAVKEENGTLRETEKKRLENARAAEKALKLADDYVLPGSPDEKPGGSLWLYDPDAFDGDGRVAIGVGDLDTADDVAIHIPGIKTEMDDAPGYAQNAVDLYESARFNGDGSSVATMFWLGYDTPDDAINWATITEGRAKDGGERLADAVDGLRASRPDRAHITAIGHSYGSTATSYAATDFDLDVDDVALIGSPGTGPAGNASDFSVGADHVYSGRNSRDFVAFLGDEGWVRKDAVELGLGVDPSSKDFGAKRFEAESTDRGWGPNFDDHSRYFNRHSESLYNLGRIVDGHGSDIVSADHSYDPWWSDPIDPEWYRDPTTREEGRSLTGEDF